MHSHASSLEGLRITSTGGVIYIFKPPLEGFICILKCIPMHPPLEGLGILYEINTMVTSPGGVTYIFKPPLEALYIYLNATDTILLYSIHGRLCP